MSGRESGDEYDRNDAAPEDSAHLAAIRRIDSSGKLRSSGTLFIAPVSGIRFAVGSRTAPKLRVRANGRQREFAILAKVLNRALYPRRTRRGRAG